MGVANQLIRSIKTNKNVFSARPAKVTCFDVIMAGHGKAIGSAIGGLVPSSSRYGAVNRTDAAIQEKGE